MAELWLLTDAMRIGILAKIHGHLEHLRSALASLRQQGVERTVVLGDLIESRRNAVETVSLLESHEAVGVWGNHELGLCVEPTSAIRAAYPAPVMEYFSTLAVRFELGDLLFSHGLPSQDAADPGSYYLGPRPGQHSALDASFAQFRHRIMFIGHFHQWFAATPNATVPWDGREPIELAGDQRYFVVAHAVLNGRFAIFDDSTNVLTPMAFRSDRHAPVYSRRAHFQIIHRGGRRGRRGARRGVAKPLGVGRHPH